MLDETWQPDWKNKTAYPDSDSLSYRLWAWEFLRRNSDYQIACDELGVDYFKKQRSDFFSTSGLDEIGFIGSLHESSKENEIILLLCHLYKSHILLKNPPKNPIHYMDRPQWCDTFGVKVPDHYSENYPITLFSFENERHLSETSPSDAKMPCILPDYCEIVIDHKKHKARIIIDLKAPLEPQINSIRKNLINIPQLIADDESMAKNRKREEYQQYIRILDAVTAGFSPMEIAEVLFPDEENSVDKEYPLSKKIKNDRKAAEKLRDGGYRSLSIF